MTANERTPAGGGRGKVGVALVGLIVVLGGLFVIGTLPRLRNQKRLDTMAQEVRSATPVVLTITPHLAADSDLLLPGSIQAIEETVISARTSGYVRKRYVDIGSRVKAGQTLAEIESPEVDQQLAQASADTAKSQAVVGQSQADVARLQAGVSQARSEVARQRANVKQAQAQLASTRSRLAQARAAQANAEAKVQQSEQALEVQKANLTQGEANRDLAKATAQRYTTLYKQGFISQQETEERQTALTTATATVQALKAAVNSAQADIQAAQQSVNAAKAAVQSAQSDVEASKENINAAQSAVASTQSTVQAAQQSVNASQANVGANRAAVQSSQANAQRYTVLRSFEKVVAPFDGVITSRNIDTGALVKADTDPGAGGKGLFGLARTDTLRLTVNVPQTNMNAIHVGQKVTILVREFPGRLFTGTVFQNTGALDPNTRTLQTEIHLPNPGAALKPGMYAQVQFPAADRQALPRIPANTLLINADGTRVAIVTADNKIHLATVQFGRDYGQEIEVLQGLKGKENLVANPTDDLKEGMEVQAQPAPAPPPVAPTTPVQAPPASSGSAPPASK